MLKYACAKGGWTVERVFGIFPRLAERRHHCGALLSGGEHGMLAVGRALMIDPQLILMDEPSEGLAPVMVKHLEEIILGLKREGLSILPVEQHLYGTTGSRRSRLRPGDRQVVHPANVGELAQHTGVLFTGLGVH
jgi:branched-chain amino acid transport system ATP-binding protein